MKKHLSLPLLLFALLLFLGINGPDAHAQTDQCPRIYREGSLLRTDSAQSYQWYRNGEHIPGATQQTYTPTGKSATFAVQIEGKASQAYIYSDGPVGPLITGIAFDEHLRPLVDALITIGKQRTITDQAGKFSIRLIQSDSVVRIVGTKAGHWTNQRRITTTGRQTHVQLMLRSQPFEHELSATRGGTISRGAFFLTLQPYGVLDANNQRYTGPVKIALNGGQPDSPNFGWMMPGGDFMAQDAQARERMLLSYGFLSAHLQTPSGQPLKLDPNIGAQLRFVMPHKMVANAPDSIPLWHFDEPAGFWKEEGFASREGAAYVGTVRHFSSWNCDVPSERTTVRGRVLDCKRRPIAQSPIRVGQTVATTDSTGTYTCFVPAQVGFNVRSMNANDRDTIAIGPLAARSEATLPDLAISGSGLYGYGVIDTSNTLTIRSYNTRGIVEYSIDNGASYQAANSFPTHMDSTYQIFVRDSMDCPTKVNYVRLGAKSACQMLDRASLTQAPMFDSIEEAFASPEPVYKMGLGDLFDSNTQFTFSAFDYFPCLNMLIISYYDMDSLPESITRLTQLQTLALDVDGIRHLPESIGNLTQLRVLKSENGQLTRLPESVVQLTDLVVLGLQSNRIDSLPESIGNLTRLEMLVANMNRLTTLPQSIGNLSQLNELYLNGNQLSSVPESIGNLIQLQFLMLSNNHLTALPESIGNLTQLKKVELRNNKITALPASIGRLSNTTTLILKSNQLSSLPESIGNLQQLTEINLDSNRLRNLPESFGRLSQIKKLEINDNQLTSLPESIGNLMQLERIWLNNNQITALPSSIGQLSQLRSLSIHNNRLANLPESIGRLTQLNTLELAGNQLTSLPEFIGNISELAELNLSYNQLTTLPNAIANLSKLRTLYLSGNTFTSAERVRIRGLLPRCRIVF
jgi:Leucine-rich repeat (LRR) protein